jgi:hypothetical protein
MKYLDVFIADRAMGELLFFAHVHVTVVLPSLSVSI